jgi:hypothetical protein
MFVYQLSVSYPLHERTKDGKAYHAQNDVSLQDLKHKRKPHKPNHTIQSR